MSALVGIPGDGRLTESELAEAIIGVLAEIRAMPFSELVAEIDARGIAGVMVSSHEMVAILVMLEPVTGVDPTDRDVLKGCSLQSLEQVVAFVKSEGTVNA